MPDYQNLEQIFELQFVGRIERELQRLVERDGAEKVTVHRREHLDVADGIKAILGGQTRVRQLDERVLDLLRLARGEKKEVAAA